jgi:hypothetical protein
MKRVFYRPVKTDGIVDQGRVRLKGCDVQTGFFFFITVAFEITYRFNLQVALSAFSKTISSLNGIFPVFTGEPVRDMLPTA